MVESPSQKHLECDSPFRLEAREHLIGGVGQQIRLDTGRLTVRLPEHHEPDTGEDFDAGDDACHEQGPAVILAIGCAPVG